MGGTSPEKIIAVPKVIGVATKMIAGNGFRVVGREIGRRPSLTAAGFVYCNGGLITDPDLGGGVCALARGWSRALQVGDVFHVFERDVGRGPSVWAVWASCFGVGD